MGTRSRRWEWHSKRVGAGVVALIEAAFRYTDIGTMSTKQMEELRKKVLDNDDSLKNC